MLQQICHLFLSACVLSAVLTASRQHYTMELLGDISSYLDLEGVGDNWSNCRQLCMVQTSTIQVTQM